MYVLIRASAIFVEVLILGAIAYHVLNGARLTLFDLGIRVKYARIIGVAFIAIGCILLTFFVSHLISFYPPE